MSRTSFGVLARLALRHGWFADGALLRVGFVVPGDAARLMSAGRLQARMRDGVLHLLVERGEAGTPHVVLPEGSTLWVGVAPDLAGLAHVTQDLVPRERQALFENRAAFSSFDEVQPMALAGPWFTLSLAGLARPCSVAVTDANGRRVMALTVQHADADTTLDLRRLPPGRYRVETSDGAAPAQRIELMLHPELHAAGVSIVCGLRIGNALYAAPQPPTWLVALTPPAQRIEYYVVARNFAANEFNQLTVADRGFADEGRAEIQFDRVAEADLDPTSDLTPALLGDGPGVRIALFRSRTAVARRERALRRLQLDRNGSVLIENLPAPGADRARPQFVIHLAKP